MTMAQGFVFPHLQKLPDSMPRDGAISFKLEEGVPVFRASTAVQARVELLLEKQLESGLTGAELDELDQYEIIDDYLSYLNRLVRNLHSDGSASQFT